VPVDPPFGGGGLQGVGVFLSFFQKGVLFLFLKKIKKLIFSEADLHLQIGRVRPLLSGLIKLYLSLKIPQRVKFKAS